MTRLAETLCRVPLAVRGQTRKQFFEDIFPGLASVGADHGAAVQDAAAMKESFKDAVDQFSAAEGLVGAD